MGRPDEGHGDAKQNESDEKGQREQDEVEGDSTVVKEER